MIKARNIYAYPKLMENLSTDLNLLPLLFKVIKVSDFLTQKVSYADLVSLDTNYRFSIDYDVPIADEFITGFLQMTFYPTFSKDIIITNTKSKYNTKNKLQEAAAKQGHLDLIFFDSTDSVSLSIEDFTCKLIQTTNPNEFDLLIPDGSKVNTHYIKLLTEETICPLPKKEILPSSETLALELSNTKLELENYKTYLQIAINQEETSKILAFYHTQYEVLPDWYKKIGHVIKIITGKRKIFN